MDRKLIFAVLAVAVAGLLSACAAGSYEYAGYGSNGYVIYPYGPSAIAPPIGGGPSGNPYGYENDNSNFAPYHGHGERMEPVPD